MKGFRTQGPDVKGQGFAGTEGIERTRRGRNIPVRPVDVCRHTGREHQGSGFTEATAGGQDEAGHDAREAGRQEDVPDSLPMRGTQAQAAVAVARRQVAQGVFGNGRDQRQGQDGYGQGAGHEVPLRTGHDDEDQVAEQADDDRRQGGQGFDGHADPMSDAPFLGVFGQEDTGRDPRNGTGDEGQNDEVNRIEEHVPQTGRAEGQELRGHAADAADDDVEDKGDEQDDGKGGTAGKDGRHHFIFLFFRFNTCHINSVLLLIRKRH